MVIFESFWDSGVARIGENGAKGWSYWYDNKDLEPESEPIPTSELSCNLSQRLKQSGQYFCYIITRTKLYCELHGSMTLC